MKNFIITNTIWNTAGTAIYFACQWLITLIVVWIYDDFTNAGLLALAMNITNFFFCISSYNIRTFQVSDIKNEYTDNEYIINRYLTCGISLLLCILFIFIIDYTFIQRCIIIFYMIFRCNEAYIDVLHGIDQKHWRMDFIGISLIIRGISMLVIFIIIGKVFDLLPAIIGMAVITLLIGIIFDTLKIKKISVIKKYKLNNIFHLLKQCFPLMLVILIGTFIVSFSRFSVERIYGAEALGIYASVITPAVFIQLTATFLFAPLINIMADCLKNSNLKQFIKVFIYTCIFIFGLTLIAYITVSFIGEWVLVKLFGEEIRPYAYILNGAIIISGLTAFVWLMNIAFTTIRDIKGILIGNILSMVICIIITNYFLVKFYLIGANYVMIICLSSTLIYLFIKLYINIKINNKGNKHG